jgi:hypothetical protein
MDEELLKYLDGRFASLAKLIEDHSASLQREMADRSESLQREMRAGFESLEAATVRNTSMIADGAKTVAALTEWAGKRDQLDSKRAKEISDLRARIAKLERNSAS